MGFFTFAASVIVGPAIGLVLASAFLWFFLLTDDARSEDDLVSLLIAMLYGLICSTAFYITIRRLAPDVLSKDWVNANHYRGLLVYLPFVIVFILQFFSITRAG